LVFGKKHGVLGALAVEFELKNMRSRPTFWILLILLCVAGVWFLFHQGGRRTAESAGISTNPATASASLNVPGAGTAAANASKSGVVNTNRFAYRLGNTTKSLGALVNDPRAILLENALIDTRLPLNLAIPKNLQAKGDPGAYIVQAHGPTDGAFRAMLAASGARIVSYIPNNAYLVSATAGVANEMTADGYSVVPFEPYYKLPSSLLAVVAEGQPQVINELKVAAYPDTAAEMVAALEKAGLPVVAEESSPFGEVFTVRNVSDVAALAQMSMVQRIEPYYRRVHANDLSRPSLGVAADSLTQSNYMNLYGSNVIVDVNDSGIDDTHPDLVNRILGAPANLMDTDGHGTFVAGEIAGDGTESITVTNAEGSINPGTNGQYRGKAPLAKLFSMNYNDSDQDLQQDAALTNALISNNSWDYGGDTTYDLAAASYDAATRDALPFVTGSQPVLFVFAAGNAGNGDDANDPGGGNADTIDSPATAKDVITVGAIQELRNITNFVTDANGDSNTTPWAAETSTSYRVAGFSSRGDVGIGTEGTYGRYKPDVVAPGTFIISTRSSQWDIVDYFYQSPTNNDVQEFDGIIAQPDSIWASAFPTIPNNTVQVTINVFPNADSPNPFPELPIYYGLENSPSPSGYDYVSTNYAVSIPPDNNLSTFYESGTSMATRHGQLLSGVECPAGCWR
jgi:subtilisin family serine protease